MKKILTILFITIGFNSVGQTVESVTITQPIITFTIPEYKGWDSVGHRQVKSDTVKVMMMVTDTSTLAKGYIEAIVIKGYNVLRFISAGWEDGDRQIMEHWEHDKYLDDKKKPLNKDIIVWQSRKIK